MISPVQKMPNLPVLRNLKEIVGTTRNHTNRASITVQRHHLFGRHYWLTYHWTGPLYGFVYIDRGIVEDGGSGGIRRERNALVGFPWPLTIIQEEMNFAGDGYLCVRTDVIFGWWCPYIYRIFYLLGSGYRQFMWRTVLTCTLWGLGYVEPGTIVEWSCLRKKRPR